MGQWMPQLQTPPPNVPTVPGNLPSPPPVPPEGWLDQFLAFIYTLAHWVGGVIVELVENIVPLETPQQLVDPIGYLTLLTILLLVSQIAKKVVWGVVVVGWVLIGIRIILEILEKQP
ncbi:hypothetical protein C2W62_25475 [Candidatus Entotheonella serta]|nr:hypothetical protein C2W62_25475 [Candidatus Entotheonella serta]